MVTPDPGPHGLSCPLCSEPPMWLLGGGRQAWCGNEDCKVITWNPTLTTDELINNLNFIDLRPPGKG